MAITQIKKPEKMGAARRGSGVAYNDLKRKKKAHINQKNVRGGETQ
jgi:hypothetical protein